MTSLPIRSLALGAAAATALATLAAVAPAMAASPSFSVTCTAAAVEAPRNELITFDLSCADADGQPVDEYVAVSQPTKAQTFTLDPATGRVAYRSLPRATGTDTFTFQGTATGLADSPVTSAVITLENRRPSCEPVAPLTVRHGASVVVPLACADADGDTLQIRTGDTGASHGAVRVQDGEVVYAPIAGYTGPDSFSLVATDGDLFSEQVPVAVTVTNARPTCTGRDLRTAHGRAVTFPVSCVDADGDALTRSVVARAQHGTVTLQGGTATYRPAAGYVGQDVFTLGATDGVQASVAARFTVRVTNAIPTCRGTARIAARAKSRAVRTRVPVRIACTDADRDAVRISVAAAPKRGQLVRKGARWAYVAPKGFRGRVTFSLRGTDGVATSKPVKYVVTVKAARKPNRKR